MNTGIVKRWFDERGFGFIRPDDGSPDLFTHMSHCGNQALPEGSKVEYQIASDARKRSPVAAEVKVIN